MIQDLFDGTFTITSASGNQLSILGYIEINVSLPGLSRPVPSLIMVLADSILNENMPALIGSNILEVWKHTLIRDDTDLPMVINDKAICAAVTQVEVVTIPMAVVTSQHPRSNSISSQHFITTNSAVSARAQADKDAFVGLFNRDAWPAAYRDQLEDLLWKNRDVFATSHHELGKCDITKHEILLSDYTPIKQKYRRIAPHLFDSVKEELRKLHESGVIRPSMSPWASPVSVSLKKDGSPRICLDLRKVNTVTKKDAKSVPNVQEMFDMLHGKRVFSSLDLYSGFHQIELEESSKELTAFTCGPLGFWEMNRLPFGACNSSATFQRTMEAVLGDLLYSTSLVYVDDIIIHSTNESQHIDNLDKVFSRLLQHGLRLKPSKCTFFSTELKFLGHMVTNNGLEKDPSKIQDIIDWSRPTSPTEVRRFMGMCGFLRKFIKDFATIAAPITDLLRGYSNKRQNKKQNKVLEQCNFKWTDAQETAFQTLKKVIAEDVTLVYADFSRPFRLSTDACRTGLGAILEQQEPSGHWRPIGFASRRTNDTEINYPTHKLEFLSLRWAITEKFSDYLRTHHFTVYSDNNPLTYILTNKKLDATAQRWVSSLEPYSFTIKYKPGIDNTVADALSRRFEGEDADNTRKYQDWVKTVCEGFAECPSDQPQVAAITIHDTLGDIAPTTDYDWVVLQESDASLALIKDFVVQKRDLNTIDQTHLSPETCSLLKCYGKLIVTDDLLYYQASDDCTPCLVIPHSHQNKLTTLYHSLGHLGINKVLPLLKERFYWKNMKQVVTDIVSSCDRCQKSKTHKNRNRGPLEHIQSIPVPMHQLSMDFLQIDTRADSKFKLLTVIDEFTKFAWAIVVKSENASKTADKLYRELYTKFGIPSIVHTDRGQTFVSKVIKQLNAMLSIKHTTTTSYRPQSNATCERLNETLITRIRSLAPREKSKWNLHVDSLVFAYNYTVHESIGMSPYYAMFGRQPKLPLDLMVRLPETLPQQPQRMKTYASERAKEMKEAFKVCADNIKKRRIRSKRNFDDKNVKNTTLAFNVADKVLIVKHVTRNKVDDHYDDEIYEVKERKGNSDIYVVQGIESAVVKTIHRDYMILFKQAPQDPKPMKIKDLPTWQDMLTPEVCSEEVQHPVKKNLNKKITLYYGDQKTLHPSDAICLPDIVDRESATKIFNKISPIKGSTFVIAFDKKNKATTVEDILMVLQILRQEAHLINRVILSTSNHTVFNLLVKGMSICFPKTTPTKTKELDQENQEESSTSSEYENAQGTVVAPPDDNVESSTSETSSSSDSSDEYMPDSDSDATIVDESSDERHTYELRRNRTAPERYGDGLMNYISFWL